MPGTFWGLWECYYAVLKYGEICPTVKLSICGKTGKFGYFLGYLLHKWTTQGKFLRSRIFNSTFMIISTKSFENQVTMSSFFLAYFRFISHTRTNVGTIQICTSYITPSSSMLRNNDIKDTKNKPYNTKYSEQPDKTTIVVSVDI